MTSTTTNPKTLTGTVISDKMKDTVVVSVDRFEKHARYGKFIKSSKKFKAHNPGNTVAIGTRVTIRECRPISKDKHFEVVETTA